MACSHGYRLKSASPHSFFSHFPKIKCLLFDVKVCKSVGEVCVFLNMMVEYALKMGFVIPCYPTHVWGTIEILKTFKNCLNDISH